MSNKGSASPGIAREVGGFIASALIDESFDGNPSKRAPGCLTGEFHHASDIFDGEFAATGSSDNGCSAIPSAAWQFYCAACIHCQRAF
jgi:hypothetical protein